MLVFKFKGCGFESYWDLRNFCKCQISEWILMSILEHYRYPTDSFQSDIFFSDIGITDVNVGCRISPTLGSMSMPTYENNNIQMCAHSRGKKKLANSWNIHIPQPNNWHVLWHFVYFPEKKGNIFRNVQANCDILTPKWTKNLVDPMSHTSRAGHNRRQFDESTMNLSIDIVDCRLSIGLRNSVVGLSLQN